MAGDAGWLVPIVSYKVWGEAGWMSPIVSDQFLGRGRMAVTNLGQDLIVKVGGAVGKGITKKNWLGVFALDA